MKKMFITDVVSATLIFLFVYAAVSKLADYQNFKVQLAKSPIVHPLASFIAILIPVFEVVISIGLMISRFQLLCLYCSYTLMVVFTAYIISILRFSSYIPCSCGGVLQNMSWQEHLVFNIIFVSMSAVAILFHPQKKVQL